ncbi:hypothetical protein PV08_09950 [Exophiala spinifera]|uniref:Uncharacterized protein n=1 Tax=Exophiala spinifera TaxID=91928 RepID=A0A0D1ZII2_9EURO|nr:uncharacterized protein PV08_09950 [Exophiala spinifera]KIW12672.1 hypothetical protein PV08_09950 [Exophiala spinifera]
MLTIAEASGLIAAGVMICGCLESVKDGGLINHKSRSVVNRAISTTLWPHLVRSDGVNMRHTPMRIRFPGCAATIGAILLVVASVLTPFGLYEEIDAGSSQSLAF